MAKYDEFEEDYAFGIEYYFDYLAAHQGSDLYSVLANLYNDMDSTDQMYFLADMQDAFENFSSGDWSTWAEWLNWLVENDWATWKEIREWYE